MARALVDAASMSAVLCDVCTASKRNPPVEIAACWIRSRDDETRVLIAIDAPLGWPDAMRSKKFVQHVASQRVNVSADKLFTRATDRQIERRLNKKPLAVGADRIARTAHAALDFLSELSSELGLETLPLAWSPLDVQASAPSVIEAYPAATLLTRGVSTGSYRKRGRQGREDRSRIVRSLPELALKSDVDGVARSDHTVDAAVCVLAGLDFLAAKSEGPNDRLQQQAKREGWIWA